MATRDVTLRDMLHRAADWFPQGERVVDELFRYTYPELREQVQRGEAIKIRAKKITLINDRVDGYVDLYHL